MPPFLGRHNLEQDIRHIADILGLDWARILPSGAVQLAPFGERVVLGNELGPAIELVKIEDRDSLGDPILDAGGEQQVRYGLRALGVTGVPGIEILTGTVTSPETPVWRSGNGDDYLEAVSGILSRYGAGAINAPYVLTVGCANTGTVNDGEVVYFGCIPGLSLTTGAGLTKVYFPRAGTLTRADIMWHAGTAGTNEDIVLAIRLNNTTDYAVATVATTAASKHFTNSALSIPIAAGDYVEIKVTFPTWVTNPANVRLGGYLYVQ